MEPPVRNREMILKEAMRITKAGGDKVYLGQAVQIEILPDIRDILAEQTNFMLDSQGNEEDEAAPMTCSRCIGMMH